MFRALLVPVDLAEPEIAQPAIDLAVNFVRANDGRLRFINVQSVVPTTFMEYVPADFDVLQNSRADEGLRALAATTGLASEKVSTIVRTGGIYPEILAEAEEWRADLVIIGSHRPAMSTYLLGSNATTIVRHATCSVLVVRGAQA